VDGAEAPGARLTHTPAWLAAPLVVAPLQGATSISDCYCDNPVGTLSSVQAACSGQTTCSVFTLYNNPSLYDISSCPTCAYACASTNEP